MFDDHSDKRTFFSAPQSVTSLLAALLEPVVTVLTFLAANRYFRISIGQPELILCLFLFALVFPGRNRFRQSLLSAAVDIVYSWLVVVALLAFCGYSTRSLGYFAPEALSAWVCMTPVLQWVVVWAGQKLLRHSTAHPNARRRAVVVGAGALGVKVAKALNEGHAHGFDFMGYFDDRRGDRVMPAAVAQCLGGLNDLAEYTRCNGIHDVFITLPMGSQLRIVELLEQIQGTTASLFFVPDVFGISIIQGRLQDMNGVPVVGICDTPFTGTNALIKRISDIVLTCAILALMSPVMLALALGVKFSSKGPVIFKQRRNGLGGEEIVVYKFRSMTVQDDGAVVRQATRHDPRITPFGAFIRKTSLDELPQFFNVLQGRMSIVGPRPHAVAHNEEYRRIIKAYMVRHKVKPGISGWAQVNGCRGETDTIEKMQARLEYDLEYLRNWSLALDLQVIARTIRLVFFDRAAY
jgi:putative colanic acid biosynthesis UDP-glucose lipid carrier transferase